MPLYDYKCNHCGHEMPSKLRPHTATTTTCDKCGKDAERKFSGKFVSTGLPNGHIAARRRPTE